MLSEIKNGKRTCFEYVGDFPYTTYLAILLGEAGYSLVYLNPPDKILEFCHTRCEEMRIIVILQDEGSWYHNIICKDRMWGVVYCGKTKYHEIGNKILHLIRESFLESGIYNGRKENL